MKIKKISEKIISDLEQAKSEIKRADEIGNELAKNINIIYLIGCGAPNRVMLGIEYWILQLSDSLEVRKYYPAEFMEQKPVKINNKTLFIFGSKSGTTKETVKAAEMISGKGYKTIAITESKNVPLAKFTDIVLTLGKSDEGHTGMFMILQVLIGSIINQKDKWKNHKQLIESIYELPKVICKTQEEYEDLCYKHAKHMNNEKILYHLASGPMFTTAYVFSVCILMEMLWIHNYPIEAAEFFHGPFEIVDENTFLLLMLGEDSSRPLMNRVVNFCKKYSNNLIIYDTRDFEMKGINKIIRPIVAPYVLNSVLKRIADHISQMRNHPLTTRKYMWKTEY